MKLSRKLLLFALTAILAVWSAPALADTTDFAYRVEDGAITIAVCFSQETSVTIPSELDGMAVTKIANSAFSTCEALEEVFIPATVTEVGTELFGVREDVTIIGEAGSYIAQYCDENQISFQEEAVKERASALGNHESILMSIFPDVPSDQWYTPYIKDLYEQGIVNGYKDGSFKPGRTISRAEFATMLALASGDEIPETVEESGFSDVPTNQWYAPVIAWAAEHKITYGYGDGTFHPLDFITRQEIMVMQRRYATEIAGQSKLPVIVSEMLFTDAISVGKWAKEDVRALQMAGIICGEGNNMLQPKANSTRAEAARIISSFLSLLKDDNTDKEIKGLMFMPDETYYWQDGALQKGSAAPIKQSNCLMAPLRIYGEYHGATLAKEKNVVLLTMPDGRSLSFAVRTSEARTNEGETIILKQPTVVQNGVTFVDIASIASFFDDKSTISSDGTAYLFYPAGASVNQDNWIQGSQSVAAYRKAEEEAREKTVTVQTVSYGSSGKGRKLAYTSIAPYGYTKTIMLVFEQHGFEDSYAKDGQLLVNAANNLISHYSKQGVESFKGTRIIIVASANPDGLAEGYTNNGPGRCTIVGKVDMNRDWPTSNWVRNNSSRYHTLSPLSCSETKNLRTLISSVKPKVLLDIHGWLNGVYGDRALASVFKQKMNLPYASLFSANGLNATDVTYLSDEEIQEAYASGLVGFRGYLAGYGHEQGIRSALVELKSPKNVNTNGLINAVNAIIKTVV